jgi:hypothetical protein
MGGFLSLVLSFTGLAFHFGAFFVDDKALAYSLANMGAIYVVGGLIYGKLVADGL